MAYCTNIVRILRVYILGFLSCYKVEGRERMRRKGLGVRREIKGRKTKDVKG